MNTGPILGPLCKAIPTPLLYSHRGYGRASTPLDLSTCLASISTPEGVPNDPVLDPFWGHSRGLDLPDTSDFLI